MARALNAIRERLLAGADLLIDFATLGEYGLEPGRPRECERRQAPEEPLAIPPAPLRAPGAISS